MRRYRALLCILIVSLITFVGLALYAEMKSNDTSAIATNPLETSEASSEKLTEAQSESTTPVETEPPTEAIKEVTLVAVGDDLIHTPLLDGALQEDGSYNFDSLFEVMIEDFRNADIAVINQETMLGGLDNGLIYDGYPNFNSPDSLGDALLNAGFDVILHASNHSRDAGLGGITHCINYWKTHSDKALMLGLNETQEERDTIRIYEKDGIKFAMLNYTYGLNGYTLPDDQQYLVNLMTDSTKDQVKADIEKAESMADFVIVFPHWGTEDETGAPNSMQTDWAAMMTTAGADLIIGTHPHVLQSIEWIETENGNKALCYYSLGNYISNQQELPEVLGGMAKVIIVKENDKTYIKNEGTGIIPIVTQNDRRNSKPLIQTYHLKDYTEEMAKIHDIYNRFDSSFSKEKLQALAVEVLGDWILE